MIFLLFSEWSTEGYLFLCFKINSRPSYKFEHENPHTTNNERQFRMMTNSIFSLTNSSIKNTLIAATLASLVGCGGGGSSADSNTPNTTADSFTGNSAAATASQDNAEALAITAFEGVTQALETEGAQLPIGTEIEDESAFSLLNDLLSKEYLSLPTGATYTDVYQGSCGGTETFTWPGSIPSIGSRFTVKMAYDNFCDGGGYIIDGIFEYTATYMGDDLFHDMSLIYDVRYSYEGQIYYSINMVAQCSGEFDDVNSSNCIISSNFTGISGGTYRIENVALEEGYVSATVYESTLGRIDIVGNNLHQCSNGNFDSGEILITDSTGEAVITLSFSSCNEYVITYEGVANTYTQLNN